MASRRNAKPRRPQGAAATTPPVAPPAPAPSAGMLQTRAAEQAAEALLADARREAEQIRAAAHAEALATMARSNEEQKAVRTEAEATAARLTAGGEQQAAEVIEQARRQAQQLRAAADGDATDRQAAAELAAQRTEKTAQAAADELRDRAAADAHAATSTAHDEARRIIGDATHQAGKTLDNAKREAERLLADAQQARDTVARYAEQRMQQAMDNARTIQEQAVTDLGTAQSLHRQAEETQSEAGRLRAEAQANLTASTTRTARRLHRKDLKEQAAKRHADAKAQDRAAAKALRETQGTSEITTVHRVLIGLIILGAAVIAAIGFSGSYSAVRDLAAAKGFGAFADYLPIGIDAGIGVLLALDLLLTWRRMPLPLLRHTAWGLTGATVAFNAAASWPDPIGVGMHMVMPLLFVIVIEAARHAIGRFARVTANQHTETPKLVRWLLAFRSTVRMWRRQHVWSVNDLDEALKGEQDRFVYIRGLQAKYDSRRAWTKKGRGWRQLATEHELMPLDLYDTGVAFGEARRTADESASESSAPLSPPPARPGVESRHESAGESARESAAAVRPKRRESAPQGRESGKRESGLKVSPIGDIDGEIAALVALMQERGDADAVTLTDAEAITNRSQATAARRLSTAREMFRKSA
ncbi:DUF2637 domain-containing protein [Streptomyces sp. H27-D2]|uniref:DUF2637 domain-containing protein n=1 Tax=Streptomyces sp. H27-D2 TaxID=3046304 RepID=UPI002DBBB541|nr:DUF2637 domain-containing protein [Streptomyces sp. H27-D2]MEC4016073.1 DUF2637 domain-containing protein [Streptomyces sp. H27-D2]